VIRRILPEMPGYLERNAESAGSFTQKEAGFVQELLTLEGLSRGKNVLVDGSLRNATWNKVGVVGKAKKNRTASEPLSPPFWNCA